MLSLVDGAGSMNAYGHLVAAFYDRWYEPAEKAGLSDLRGSSLRGLSGKVLEIGAGTGLNTSHFPDSVNEIAFTEPDPPMARRLSARLARTIVPGRLSAARAEQLPFEDDEFDAVVSTFTLCTVDSVPGALAEVNRVLKPGGSFRFLEHIRADDPAQARWQDRLHGIWYCVGNGCHCNLRTVELISDKFDVENVSYGDLPKAPFLWRPYALGSATPRPA